MIANKKVSMLVDTCKTSSFMTPEIVELLGLEAVGQHHLVKVKFGKHSGGSFTLYDMDGIDLILGGPSLRNTMLS